MHDGPLLVLKISIVFGEQTLLIGDAVSMPLNYTVVFNLQRGRF